jgi:hypothetical protein
MRKGFLIYEEMRKCFPKYEEAVSQLCNCSFLNFLIYDENVSSLFYQCEASTLTLKALGKEFMC